MFGTLDLRAGETERRARLSCLVVLEVEGSPTFTEAGGGGGDSAGLTQPEGRKYLSAYSQLVLISPLLP